MGRAFGDCPPMMLSCFASSLCSRHSHDEFRGSVTAPPKPRKRSVCAIVRARAGTDSCARAPPPPATPRLAATRIIASTSRARRFFCSKGAPIPHMSCRSLCRVLGPGLCTRRARRRHSASRERVSAERDSFGRQPHQISCRFASVPMIRASMSATSSTGIITF